MTSIYVQPSDLDNRAIPVSSRAPSLLVIPFNMENTPTNPYLTFSPSTYSIHVQRCGVYFINAQVQLIYIMNPTPDDTRVYNNFRVTIQVKSPNSKIYLPVASAFQDILPNYQSVPDGRWNTIQCTYMANFQQGDLVRVVVAVQLARNLDVNNLFQVLIGTTEPGTNNVEEPPLVPVTILSMFPGLPTFTNPPPLLRNGLLVESLPRS